MDAHKIIILLFGLAALASTNDTDQSNGVNANDDSNGISNIDETKKQSMKKSWLKEPHGNCFNFTQPNLRRSHSSEHLSAKVIIFVYEGTITETLKFKTEPLDTGKVGTPTNIVNSNVMEDGKISKHSQMNDCREVISKIYYNGGFDCRTALEMACFLFILLAPLNLSLKAIHSRLEYMNGVKKDKSKSRSIQA